MNVVFSELAEQKLIKLSDYLLSEWNVKVRNNFIKKLKSKIEQISKQPNSCPESSEHIGLFKCVVTKQTTFYYKIDLESNSIVVLTLFDTRQDPNELHNQVK
ncbi:type II toxin-antitoxin system RelE/ParE family toxin [Rasiella rasia]|uniref:Type II toxin-antitoxin system RelE/ParE family toxin n=1 Tax=Rasiella rasia TaxID=2744027 RepID=A0A6G6GJE0_9FLAO|nr:type II toxin-antitoxin system RelE/ParE family toxin [Rasiella rasia]QIE58658.1 type II toxin-antitoxin system RelE/ParE family toxin [Rasiella rasia]